MSRESLFAVRFWKRTVIGLDRAGFLRWLDLKGQVIGDRCSNGREIQLVIAEALDMPGQVGRERRQLINGWDVAFLCQRIQGCTDFDRVVKHETVSNHARILDLL